MNIWNWLFHRKSREKDLDDEVQSHLRMAAEERLALGESAEDAQSSAAREFGNEVLVKEVTRDMWGFRWFEILMQDVRYGLRQLLHHPGFTTVAVITLALGIGANTAIFSLIDAVLLKMLPVQNPQQLVLLNWTANGSPFDSLVRNLSGTWDETKGGRLTSTSFSYPIYEQIRNRNQAFSSVTALAGNGSDLNVGYNGQPARADGELVSGTFFSTLGVQPILGRAFSPGDDRIGAVPAAVISYGYWERRFGRDPGVLGRTITVNSVPFTIVGIGPPEFYGVQPGRSVEVWLPLHMQPKVEPRWSPEPPELGKDSAGHPGSLFEADGNWWVIIVGRLKSGVGEREARAGLEVILQQTIAEGVKINTKPEAIPHLGVESGSKGLNNLRQLFSKPLFILMTVVGLVLLIACANVANLLLARAASRQKEIAVRLAVGAARGRLVRQLLTESVMLAGLGGAVGLILAFWGTHLLVAFIAGGPWPAALNVSPDLRVLGFTAAVSMLTGILFGLSPALRATRVDLTPTLKESAGEMAAGAPGRRGLQLGLGSGLVVTQVSLSLVLLVGAGLFVRTLTNLENVNAGFNQLNLLLFGIDPTQDGYKGQRLATFYQELTHRLEVLPGVRSVSLSHTTLIGGGANFQLIHIPGYTPKPGEEVGAAINWVGPKFFETLGIPLVLGRPIGEGDTEGGPKAVVVNEQFVRQFLGAGNPIGRRFGPNEKAGEDIEIVGVVGDARNSDLRQEAPATIYEPWRQYPDVNGAMNFEVRTAGDPLELASAVRRVAQGMDSNLALYDLRSQKEQINQTLFQERLFARLTSLFGALAALLAFVGIYGIMAFAVSRRTREIGIRMALGAERSDVWKLVVGQGFKLALAGVAIGILAAVGLTRFLSSLLYGVRPTDPLTFVAVSLLLVSVALFACYIPARRATKVDPMVALRYE